MPKSEDIKYKIIYFGNEISLTMANCCDKLECSCVSDNPPDVRCGYNVKEARDFIMNYYQERVDYIKKSSDKEFLHDFGIYVD